MTDIIDAEVVTTAIVPAAPPQSSLVQLAAPVGDIVEAQRQYLDVCSQLLDESDLQTIGKKSFKKRSAWNKLAVAFAVSTEEVRTTHERDERGRIVRTECVVRATAPNGRVSDGLGACDLYERCCDPATCKQRTHWEDTGRPTGHVHCTEFPCKNSHFSNPQHDIPATAFTRASNRAKADLFGMGEVSAEEVSGSQSHYQEPAPTPTERWSPGDAGPAPATAPAQSRGGAKMATEGQGKMIFAVSKKLNYGTVEDAIEKFIGHAKGTKELTMAEARTVIDGLKAEEAGGSVAEPEPGGYGYSEEPF